MGHEGIFATKAECDSKVGGDVDATGWVEANINQWCAEAESLINCTCRYNFSDDYATLSSDVKKLLTEVCSDLVAIYGISYQMASAGAGYGYREAEDMINILRDGALRGLSILRDKKTQTFMKEAT